MTITSLLREYWLTAIIIVFALCVLAWRIIKKIRLAQLNKNYEELL